MNKRISQIVGLIVIAIAIIVLLGWQFDIALLKSGFPFISTTMKANTAICFLFAGLSLMLLSLQPTRLNYRVSQGLEGAIVAIGLLTLIEYFLGWDFHIDQLLFRDVVSSGTPYAGRMGINTAVNFVLMGIALLLLGQNSRRNTRNIWWAQICSSFAFLISLLALFGHIYNVNILEQLVVLTTKQALNSILGFFILHIGILHLRPNDGLMQTFTSPLFGGEIARRLLPWAIVFPVVLNWFSIEGQKLGWYSDESGNAIRATIVVVTFSILSWGTARFLNQIDVKRHQAEEKLTELNEALEGLITEKTEALQKSQALFAGILEIANDAIISVDRNQRITLFNQGAEKIFGYQLEEVLGQPLSLLLPEQFRDAHQQHIQRFDRASVTLDKRARRMVERDDIFGLRQDGTEFPAEASISRLEIGEETIFTVILRDISQRKQIETALRNSEEQFRHAFEDASIGMAIISLDGHWIKVNKALCEIIGYSSEDLSALTFQDITHPDDLDVDLSYAHQLLTGTISTYQMEKRYFHKQGHIVWILLNGSLVQDDRGNPLHFLAQIQDISARKEAQKTLELQSIIMNNMAGGVCLVKAADLTIGYTNPKFDAMFGYEEGELAGQPVGAINYVDTEVTPDASVEDIVTQLDRDGEAEYEVYNKKKDGTLFWCRVHTSRFEHPEYGTVYVAVQEDISQLKLSEQALHASTNRLNFLLNSSPVVIFSSKPNGDYGATFVSENIREVMGYDPKAFLEESEFWINHLHPDDVDPVLNGLTNLFAEDFHFQEFRLLHADGNYRWILEQLRIIRDRAGDPIEILGYLIDISDRKRAEQALIESEARFQAFMDRSPTSTWITDIDGKMLYLNQTYCKMFQLPTQEVIGKTVFDLYPDQIAQNFLDNIRRVVSTNQVIETVEIAPRPDNTIGDFLVYKFLIPSLFGQNLIGGIAIDITDRKQVELELQQAKEAAEAANLAKSMFLSNISHELRTPLNAILGFTELMSYDSSLSPENQEDLAIVNRSGKHLLELINDILDLSKIESGQMKLNLSDFDLDNLLTSIEELFQVQAQLKDLRLIVERGPALPKFIHTDEKKLYQVLVNLLGNAIKFTNQGSVILRVRLQGIATIKQAQLLFEIEDTGVGIAPTEIDSLFKAFVQAQAGNKLNQGTGLGLAISQRFIQLMGSHIQVQSILDRGSTFYFELGVKLPQNIPFTSESLRQRVIGLAPGQPTYRILIVEDIEENRLLLVKILTSVGFEVREATNGVEALSLWESWSPHLIWMDLRMPVMDGYTAIKRIREHPNGQETIIIALTASVFEDEQEKVMIAGCNDFTSKPVQERIIFDKLARHLGVKYIYKSLGQNQNKQLVETLSSDDLATMSVRWLEQMYQAAYYLDTEVMNELIKEIPASKANLSKTLIDSINNFNSDQIMELIRPLLPNLI